MEMRSDFTQMPPALTGRLTNAVSSRPASGATMSGGHAQPGDPTASVIRTLGLLTLIPAVWVGINATAYPVINGVFLLLSVYVMVIMLLPRWLPQMRRADLIVSLDILVVTLVVIASGRLSSPFLYLYYLVILEAAVRLNPRQAFAASGAIAGMIVFLWLNAGSNELLGNPLFKIGIFNAGGFFLALFLGTVVQEHRFAVGLAAAYDNTLEGWSRALELRDKETEGHTHRVTEMTVRLARAFGIPEAQIVHIRRGALLHDIGKMGVPDSILLKPGPLTDEEWEIMHRHPAYAYEMLSPISYLRPALDIPYCHHERWDGSGYPRGLRGEAIPLAARLFAVVDVWDAMRTDRPYAHSRTEDQARDHIRTHAGMLFDPHVVEVFLQMLSETSPEPAAIDGDGLGRITPDLTASAHRHTAFSRAVPGRDVSAAAHRAPSFDSSAPQPMPLAPQAPSPFPPAAPGVPPRGVAASKPAARGQAAPENGGPSDEDDASRRGRGPGAVS
jgi:hypothetical protein